MPSYITKRPSLEGSSVFSALNCGGFTTNVKLRTLGLSTGAFMFYWPLCVCSLSNSLGWYSVWRTSPLRLLPICFRYERNWILKINENLEKNSRMNVYYLPVKEFIVEQIRTAIVVLSPPKWFRFVLCPVSRHRCVLLNTETSSRELSLNPR